MSRRSGRSEHRPYLLGALNTALLARGASAHSGAHARLGPEERHDEQMVLKEMLRDVLERHKVS